DKHMGGNNMSKNTKQLDKHMGGNNMSKNTKQLDSCKKSYKMKNKQNNKSKTKNQINKIDYNKRMFYFSIISSIVTWLLMFFN
ncbi:hypothetical protein ACPMCA_16690, partial [Clostridioides difficile]